MLVSKYEASGPDLSSLVVILWYLIFLTRPEVEHIFVWKNTWYEPTIASQWHSSRCVVAWPAAVVEAPQRGNVLPVFQCADALLLFISRTNSRTLRQSSTSSSSSSQPPCSRSAWLHSSSTTVGLSVRTGRLWVCIYCLFSSFGCRLGNENTTFPCWLGLCVLSEAVRSPVFRHGADKNGFSLGFSKNLRQVFGDEGKYWLIPMFSR